MILSVVGNKTDLEQARAVSREEAFLFASSIGGTYFETSALEGGHGIEQIFASTGVELLRMSNDPACTSIKRYESTDSLLSLNDLPGNQIEITVYNSNRFPDIHVLSFCLHSSR